MTKPRYKWQSLRRAVALPPSEKLITETMRLCNMTREQALEQMAMEVKRVEVWKNDTYQVAVDRMESGVVHINIRRVDGGPIMRDWRHFQQIKNEIVGDECEAIELYPAESRKVDTSNKYHLFAVADPKFRFPFGAFFGNVRDVSYESGDTPGTRQRPL